MDPLALFFRDIQDDREQLPGTESSDTNDQDPVEEKPVEPKKAEKESDDIPPLKKCVYIESKEISNMTDEQVEQMKVDLGGVHTRGLNIPRPFFNWNQIGIHSHIKNQLDILGFKSPTPIQSVAIPCILSGRDMIGCAVTGSGKTLAFLIPCIQHILSQPPLRRNEAIGMFLSPTRELAIQTHLETKRFLKPFGMRCSCLIGGNDIEQQIKSLKNGVHIVIGTPGRVIDLINSVKTFNVRRVSYFVIDEADRMMDMGFEPQVMMINQHLRPDHISLMFSATFPHIVERCARNILKSPIEAVVGNRNQINSNITQNIEIVKEGDKFLRTLKIIGDCGDGQIIVFTNTQQKAEDVFGMLVKRGYQCSLLHAGMTQTDRACILHDFRDGKYRILVSTSVAGRGIDIRTVVLVINYDAPNHSEDYVHRIGRTGRAGNKGTAYTFLADGEEDYGNEIVRAMQRSGNKIPESLLQFTKSTKKPVKKNSLIGFRGSGFRFDKAEEEAFKFNREKEFAPDTAVIEAVHLGYKAVVPVTSTDIVAVMDETGTEITNDEGSKKFIVTGPTYYSVEAATSMIAKSKPLS